MRTARPATGKRSRQPLLRPRASEAAPIPPPTTAASAPAAPPSTAFPAISNRNKAAFKNPRNPMKINAAPIPNRNTKSQCYIRVSFRTDRSSLATRRWLSNRRRAHASPTAPLLDTNGRFLLNNNSRNSFKTNDRADSYSIQTASRLLGAGNGEKHAARRKKSGGAADLVRRCAPRPSSDLARPQPPARSNCAWPIRSAHTGSRDATRSSAPAKSPATRPAQTAHRTAPAMPATNPPSPPPLARPISPAASFPKEK